MAPRSRGVYSVVKLIEWAAEYPSELLVEKYSFENQSFYGHSRESLGKALI